ncbi:hypothetical protein AB1L16_07955 [Peribacillus frigoritolerans]|uniref:hypothetical protein n=1 Tax=Peribacillus frigoritolerans TaxID=450367 RepID=UPI0039A37F11
MKTNMTITKKESRHLQLNGITMSKQLLTYVVKDELLNFYTHRLTDFDSYSNLEKEKLLNLIQDFSNGNFDRIINEKISNKFPFDCDYNAKVIIEDDLEGCGNVDIKINLTPSWIEAMGL